MIVNNINLSTSNTFYTIKDQLLLYSYICSNANTDLMMMM